MIDLTKFLSTIVLTFSFTSPEPAKLQYNPEFILQAVLDYKKLSFRPDVRLPEIKYESQATLKEFQDDLEPQWGFRPEVITNAYVIKKNVIYLIDEKDYYERHQRCIDDSLAHELAHYIQSQYRGWDLNDDSLEWDAIDVQNWFRENYCR